MQQGIAQSKTHSVASSERAEGYRWIQQDCPVCELPPSKLLGRRGGAAHREGLGVLSDIWRCGRCGLVFPNPMPMPLGGVEQHYSLDADCYFEHHDRDEKYSTRPSLLKRAAELTGGTGRLLDIGAGRGELLRAATEAGWQCVGIEPSRTFSEYAASFSGSEVRCKPIEECDFESSSFDAVILAAVLEHLYNPDETIKEISRILRPGGALFLDVPNEQGLYFQVGNIYQKCLGRDWVVNLSPTFPPFHVFGFGPKSLKALLAKHGLRQTDWHVYGGHSVLASRGRVIGMIEVMASHAISAISNIGSLGTYIETWAIKA
jgi:SAM-dependent methyltransferase